MGDGFRLECKKCGYNVDILNGVGMLHPLLEDVVIDEIKLGKHGDDLKKMVEDTTLFLTDVTHEAFICNKCNEIKSALKIKLHFLESGKIVKVRQHCDKCGGIMKERKNINILKCPRCDSSLKVGERFCWD